MPETPTQLGSRAIQVMRNYRRGGSVTVNDDRRMVIKDPQSLAKRCR